MKLTIRQVITACQWFRNGDHFDDSCHPITNVGLSEGKIVRRYRDPEVEACKACTDCGHIMHDHGWLDNDDIVVCPSDHVIEFEPGRYFAMSYKDFAAAKVFK